MIWYITRTIAAEIVEAIRNKFMCQKTGKCQTEKTLAMDCSQLDLDCEYFNPIPTVKDIEAKKLVSDIVDESLAETKKVLDRIERNEDILVEQLLDDNDHRLISRKVEQRLMEEGNK